MNDGTATLKDLKEAFVTGHTGTTRPELLLVCVSAPIGIFLYLQITNFICQRHGNPETGNTTWGLFAFIEAVSLLLPMAICQTDLIYPWGVSILLLEIAFAFWLKILASQPYSNANDSNNRDIESIECVHRKQLHYLTSFRSTVSYLTFIAILAVDFHVFPRRFAKTETTGLGLMDLGAGSFVVSAGFVSGYARQSEKYSKESLAKIIRHSIPLIVLGCIRWFTTKSLEYQEHVSEYGVHWNFFFTLSMVNILTPILRYAILQFTKTQTKYNGAKANPTPCVPDIINSFQRFLIPFSILLCYQFCLSFFQLQEYIEYAPRRCVESHFNNLVQVAVCNIMAANREGILGCLGYMTMFCMSEEIALYCLWTAPITKEDSHKGENTVSFMSSNSELKKEYTQLRQRRAGNKENIENTSKHLEPENVRECYDYYSKWMQGKRLFICLIILISLDFFFSQILRIKVSRRSTNAAFVIWTLEFNIVILFLIWAAYFFSESSNHSPLSTLRKSTLQPSPTFTAVNRNGLIVFLIANLLTGAVNLSINTLAASNAMALSVIFGYLCTVGLIALLLDKGLDVSLKL